MSPSKSKHTPRQSAVVYHPAGHVSDEITDTDYADSQAGATADLQLTPPPANELPMNQPPNVIADTHIGHSPWRSSWVERYDIDTLRNDAFLRPGLKAKGWKSVVDHVFHEELQHEGWGTLHGIREDLGSEVLLQILMSTHWPVMRAILQGDLAEQYQRQQRLFKICNNLRIKAAGGASCIYLNLLQDNDGTSPTWWMFRQLAQDLLQYVELDPTKLDYANIDGPRFRGDGRPPWAAYLYNDGGSYQPARVQVVRDFAQALLARCQGQQLDQMALPLTKVGYSGKIESRLEAHFAQRGSDFLMNLATAILEYRHPDRNFGIASYVVYVCWSDIQGTMAEIAFTHLARAVSRHGFGFNFHPPGESCPWGQHSKDHWAKLQQWAFRFTPLQANIQAFTQDVRAICAREQKRAADHRVRATLAKLIWKAEMAARGEEVEESEDSEEASQSKAEEELEEADDDEVIEEEDDGDDEVIEEEPEEDHDDDEVIKEEPEDHL